VAMPRQNIPGRPSHSAHCQLGGSFFSFDENSRGAVAIRAL